LNYHGLTINLREIKLSSHSQTKCSRSSGFFISIIKKGEKFNWTTDCEEDFNSIEDPFHLFTKTFKIGIGAVKKQKQKNGSLNFICYFFKNVLY